MKPEAQRIAIAEACGWTAIENQGACGGWIAKMPDGQTLWDNCLGATRHDAIDANCPDYLNDLNAMHEAEKILTVDQTITFVMVLCDQLELPHALRHHARTYWILLHATAAQRAEAFLKTLNLWKPTQ